MALRHAILAALMDGESSGYDLAKSFDVTVANYWTATPQQLYRELEKLHNDGLLQARVVEQQRRPNKRLYSLTAAGREEMRAFIASSPRPTAIRDELMVQVEAMGSDDVPQVLESVRATLAAASAKLAAYERRRDAILAGRSEAQYFATAGRVGPLLTLTRGIAFERENVQWCGYVLGALGTARLADRSG